MRGLSGRARGRILPLTTEGGPGTPDDPSRRRLEAVRVLLVDDDLDTLDLERLVLQEAGAQVDCATTVEAALQQHKRNAATVIVSDLAIPERDGFDLARTLRRTKDSARIPLLAVSAHASAASREQALAAGFDMFLVKPVHPGELVKAVIRLASRARGTSSS
jgi:DNA-binding response OmpR family regulator